MAELTFTYGTMAAGKSTLALQLCWQLRQGRADVALWTFGDRSAEGMVTSRIGIEAAADEIVPGSDLAEPIAALARRGVKILVVDEAQFASVEQIDALAEMVDDQDVDVHAFGLAPQHGSFPLPTGLTNCPLRRRVGVEKRVAATRAWWTAWLPAKARSSSLVTWRRAASITRFSVAPTTDEVNWVLRPKGRQGTPGREFKENSTVFGILLHFTRLVPACHFAFTFLS